MNTGSKVWLKRSGKRERECVRGKIEGKSCLSHYHPSCMQWPERNYMRKERKLWPTRGPAVTGELRRVASILSQVLQ